jgi:hypothetical protein
MKVFYLLMTVLCISATTASASFVIQSGTGSDGWGLAPYQNTAGRAKLPSYFVGDIQNPQSWELTLRKWDLKVHDANDPNYPVEPNEVKAVIDGFGQCFWVEDANGLVPQDVPAKRFYGPAPLDSVRTYALVFTPEQVEEIISTQTWVEPLMCQELDLIVSCDANAPDDVDPVYYLRYYWDRTVVEPNTYYVALATQTDGTTICGQYESIIDANDDFLLSAPGSLYGYAEDANTYPTASAALDIYGYILGQPMVIREAGGNPVVDPNVTPEEFKFSGFLDPSYHESLVDSDPSLITGLPLKLSENVQLFELNWVSVYFAESHSGWKLTISESEPNLSADYAFYLNPYTGTNGLLELETTSTFLGTWYQEDPLALAYHAPGYLESCRLDVALKAISCVISVYADKPIGDVEFLPGEVSNAICLLEFDGWFTNSELAGADWIGYPWRYAWELSEGPDRYSGNAALNITALVLPAYNSNDLERLSENWERDDAGPDNDWLDNADLNRDGVVDHKDFVILEADWVEEDAPVEPGQVIVEGFESGNFSSLAWEHSGASYWEVTSGSAHSGIFCAQAGEVSDFEASTLKLTQDCHSGTMSFYVKTSSESSFDKLLFSIDGVSQGNWSGENDWIEVSFSIDAGSHTFQWTYRKDGSVSEGADTVWIDDI